MPLPRNLDSLFTDEDRAILADMTRAIENHPEPMISVRAYCSLRDSNDWMGTQLRILRNQRWRLVKKLRRVQAIRRRRWLAALRWMKRAGIAAAVLVAAWAIGWIGAWAILGGNAAWLLP